MEPPLLGMLMPVGGGDPIPLRQEVLTVGRRESCDICLKFGNISSIHCELVFKNGIWTIRDLGSRNGIKINGIRLPSSNLAPGTELSIATHKFIVRYEATGDVDMIEESENIFGRSLLERAGLTRKRDDDDEDD